MIHVCALQDLEKTASSLGQYRLLTLMSPAHPDESWKRHVRGPHLHLAFHDIAVPSEGLVAPDRAAIAEMIEFGRDASVGTPLLINCWAGISRSSAAAYIIACARQAGQEFELAIELRNRAPFVTPNPLMVSLADDVLSRDGRMIASVATLGRGAEAFAGSPYVMPLI